MNLRTTLALVFAAPVCLSGCWLDMATLDQQKSLSNCALSLAGGSEIGATELYQSISWTPAAPTAITSAVAQTFSVAQETTITLMTARLQQTSTTVPSSARIRMTLTSENNLLPANLIAQSVVPLSAAQSGRYLTVPFSIAATLQANVRYWAIVSIEDTGTTNVLPLSVKWLGTSASNSNPDLMTFTGNGTNGGATNWTRVATGTGIARSLALGVGCGS